MSLSAVLPCTFDSIKVSLMKGDLLLSTLMISLNTAPVSEVITATDNGR